MSVRNRLRDTNRCSRKSPRRLPHNPWPGHVWALIFTAPATTPTANTETTHARSVRPVVLSLMIQTYPVQRMTVEHEVHVNANYHGLLYPPRDRYLTARAVMSSLCCAPAQNRFTAPTVSRIMSAGNAPSARCNSSSRRRLENILPGAVHRFGEAVSIQEQSVARFEDNGLGQVLHVFLDSQCHPPGILQGDDVAWSDEPIGEIVATVAVLQFTGMDVQNAEENRHEHRRVILAAEFAIHFGQHGIRLAPSVRSDFSVTSW